MSAEEVIVIRKKLEKIIRTKTKVSESAPACHVLESSGGGKGWWMLFSLTSVNI